MTDTRQRIARRIASLSEPITMPDIKYTGYDRNNIARVYGNGPSVEVAEQNCRFAASEYVKSRPDTGPIHLWSFLSSSVKPAKSKG